MTGVNLLKQEQNVPALLLALFPFGRLLHLATSRLSYLFRPYQVVIWQRRGRRGKRPA